MSLNTYDAWPAFLTVAAVAALVGDRPKLALALLGVAAAAKLYAVLLVPVALAWLWRERRAVTGPLASFCIAAAVLVVPWVALSTGGVWDSVHSQVGRALHTESLARACSSSPTGSGGTTRTSSRRLPPCRATSRVGYRMPSRRCRPCSPWSLRSCRLRCCCDDRPRPGLAFAASVAGFLAFTKVLSPQYLVWLVPLAPFGGVAACALLVAALVLAQTWYFHYHSLWAVGPQVWTLLARNLVLVALYAVLLWKTSTPSRSKTSFQSGFARSRASAAAAGSGATRSA